MGPKSFVSVLGPSRKENLLPHRVWNQELSILHYEQPLWITIIVIAITYSYSTTIARSLGGGPKPLSPKPKTLCTRKKHPDWAASRREELQVDPRFPARAYLEK